MIYFIQATEGGPIKIGTTERFDARRKQLETKYGKPLALLASMRGGRKKEREIHIRFAHLRFKGTEQFRPTPELLAFIGRPLLTSPDPDEVLVMPTGTKVVQIESDIFRAAEIAAVFQNERVTHYINKILRGIVFDESQRLARECVAKIEGEMLARGDKPE